MAEWLRLKEVPPNPGPVLVNGVVFDVIVSPYDIPEAVRGFKTPNERFRIEFRYIDGNEPSGPERSLGEHVVAFEGRHTGRLLALEADVVAMGAQTVGVSITPVQERLRQQLDSAWNAVAAAHRSSAEKSVFENARKALRTRETDLLNQLAGT
jgi:hypothetical protein